MPLLGLHEVEAALKKVAADAILAAEKTVVRAAAVVEAEAKKNFQGAHPKGQPHQGGDRPNVVSGMLRRSIHHLPLTRFGFGDFGTRVGPATVYARRVELGWHGSRGYPYFEPAVKTTRPKYEEIAAQAWREFLR